MIIAKMKQHDTNLIPVAASTIKRRQPKHHNSLLNDPVNSSVNLSINGLISYDFNCL
jgi:hypothetical protein